MHRAASRGALNGEAVLGGPGPDVADFGLVVLDNASPDRPEGRPARSTTPGRGARYEHRRGIVGEPYSIGKAGKLLRAAKTATVSGTGTTALLVGRTRPGAVVGGLLLAAGSLLTRMGVFEAGMASAKDPKCTVIPRCARLEARQAEARMGTGDPYEATSVVR